MAFPIPDLSDIQLLENLCSTEDDVVLYDQFVNRFLPDVQKECLRICERRKLDPHVGKQIAHETFERTRKYKSFKADQVKIPNSKKAVHVYLMRIASRLFNSYHKKEKKEEVLHKTYFDEILESQEGTIDVQELERKKEITLTVFEKLNYKEKRIILADLEHKRSHKYLPDDVIDSLAEELNIKRDTVRKIRERALQKIKKAINEISPN